MTDVLKARGLGKRYGRRWALTDCNLEIPAGHVVGLVGPNGAGKTTLLHLAVGLLTPTEGTIEVLGEVPGENPAQLGRVGFLGQDIPAYARFSIEDHLRLGGWLNPTWDADLGHSRISELGLDERQRAGRLSGGQRAQLALTLALAKRPELLILDEPVAGLDPLARREFLDDLADLAAEHGASVILSSHLIADLEKVCDYLIVLVASRVQLAGEVAPLLATHHRISGPRRDADGPPVAGEVILAGHTERESTFIVRQDDPVADPSWRTEQLSLEDLVLAYMSRAGGGRARRPVLRPAR
jgi:ABC-2 type transport system ATP-binding protein